MSLKAEMEVIKNKLGMEIIDEVTCPDCGKDYEVVKRKNVEAKPSYTCPHCLIQQENDEWQRRFEEQERLERIERADRNSVIPLDIENKTFDDYHPETDLQRQAKDIAIRFVNDDLEESSLVFQGDTGIGKSHLSYCIKKGFNAKGKTAIFIDSPSLFNKIKSSFGYSDSADVQQELLNALNHCDLLVLDDIGAEYVKPDQNGFESWAADIIFQVVNSRLGKQSIYTTNYNSKQLAKKYGMLSKRIISRMMNKAKVIKVDGDDQRLKGFD